MNHPRNMMLLSTRVWKQIYYGLVQGMYLSGNISLLTWLSFRIFEAWEFSRKASGQWKSRGAGVDPGLLVLYTSISLQGRCPAMPQTPAGPQTPALNPERLQLVSCQRSNHASLSLTLHSTHQPYTKQPCSFNTKPTPDNPDPAE